MDGWEEGAGSTEKTTPHFEGWVVSRRIGGWEELDIQKKTPLERRGGHCCGRMEGWEVGCQIYQRNPPLERRGGQCRYWVDGWEMGGRALDLYKKKTPLERRGRRCHHRMPEKKKNPLR